ncbi:MAG: sodium:dicarboxylate symporter [Magnetococcales bacterium]|nr:sodium:dicarboxylate symporter [Magnetococcales bacterium]HIJ83008.1 cation:dicarboxylase symporter family transporter [Magnetococcales bacterium]
MLYWMTHPLVVFSGIGLGVFIGMHDPALGLILAPFGDIYLALLEMCVVPILMAAIISGLGRLLGPKAPKIHLYRLLFFFPLGLALASAIGIGTGLWMQPGQDIKSLDRSVLGRLVTQGEESRGDTEKASGGHLVQVLKDMVPRNVVAAMSRGPNLSILMFSILFGAALGLSRTTGAEAVLLFMEGLYQVFLKLIFWVLYGLPFGLMGLYAGQFSRSDPQIFFVLKDFIAACALGTGLLLTLYLGIVRSVSGVSLAFILKSLRKTLMLAMTSSAFATIPTALRAMQEKLHIPADGSGLVYPLGINLNRHGSVFQFALASVFMAQLYGLPLDGERLVVIWVGSMIAGMAALSGLPGMGLLAVVLGFLGLPSNVAIILMTTIDGFIVPMVVLVTVVANFTLTVLVCKDSTSDSQPQPSPVP